MSMNYKDTLFLPKTNFPMRANLAKKEPEILLYWNDINLFGRLREESKDREKFILHDGPPYANGHLHIGHALNKILKDVINRSQQMMGKNSHYVPGWDCHGLPIEWKIEEKYRSDGKDKDTVSPVEFRKECREFANQWISIQAAEFRRLGVEGDFEKPYTTMSYVAEAQIAAELGKFLMNGSLYRGAKPVMWSCIEKTALAEAEIEYHDNTSTTIYVRFPVKKASTPKIKDASVIIWTTTPWTIPGNRAIAYGELIDYVVLEVTEIAHNSFAKSGERIIIADALINAVCSAARITDYKIHARLKGEEFANTIFRHPFYGFGYDFDVRALPAAFVEISIGSGFVHIAPGHGVDDWVLGTAYGVSAPNTVDVDGSFFSHVPMFSGEKVLEVKDNGKFDFPANWSVLRELVNKGGLLAKGKLTHSYPHSWRSKAPLIFRNTPQWFISMKNDNLREKALHAIKEVRFTPASGRTRLHNMVVNRPDWCVSRQRVWGVPITVFVNRRNGEPLCDQKVIDRIIEIFKKEGSDAWFNSDPQRFLGTNYKVEDYEQVTDILDVWFDSGATHSFVLEKHENLKWPASLYLEGSDQHRGWFQSSLLESCGTRGQAPYEAVLTHGFVMAEDGKKMSKSLGNIVSPQDIYNQQGADILRLWAVGSNYFEDLRIGKEILKQHSDVYRRLRNTLRFLLGNLNNWNDSEKIPIREMPELERWVLHRLQELDRDLRQACHDFLFHALFEKLHHFCVVELSAFYFDIRKDSFYCDGLNTTRRKAGRTVLDILFNTLTAWLAPFICFTAEEAWLTRNPDTNSSVHLRYFPDIPQTWRDDTLGKKWEKIRTLRRVVTGALEVERAAKRIGSSLQAHLKLYITAEFASALDGINLAEISITSTVTLFEEKVPDHAFTDHAVPGIGVIIELAEGKKCERCWQVLADIGTHANHPTICYRCAEAVETLALSEVSSL